MVHNFNIILDPAKQVYTVQYIEQDKTTDFDIFFKTEERARAWCDQYAKDLETKYMLKPLVIPYQIILGQAKVVDARAVTEEVI